MQQSETQPKAVKVDDKNPFFKFFIGVVLSCIVYFFERNDPIGFFIEFKNYALLIFLPLIALPFFLKDKTNKYLRKLDALNKKFAEQVLSGQSNVFLGFVLGYMCCVYIFVIFPMMEVQHMQRVQQLQQMQHTKI